MKNLFVIFGGIIGIVLMIGGIYMAINNIPQWGWLIFVGFLVLGGVGDKVFKENEDEE